ncbi:MAG TPA: hypothetical protein VKA06_09890, partial [Spirochaetia bacterium]|nr:hypothetical protein [Spirochaetia bacterium]
MAEDQDKQKPKTTLIKHRKDEHDAAGDEADRKKVRVVVRRKVTKPKPKTKPATADESSTQGTAAKTDKPTGSEYKPSVV